MVWQIKKSYAATKIVTDGCKSAPEVILSIELKQIIVLFIVGYTPNKA